MVDFNNKEKLNVTKAVHEENATEYSYISGIIGLMVIFSVGLYIALTGIWNSLEKNQIALSVLFVCALVMFAVELLIRWLREGNFLHVSPLLKTGRYALFVAECLGYYILEFILLLLAILFFRVVSEYGYQQNSAYYQPWFSLLDILWKGYLAIGLPYLLLTRALQHHPKADEKEPAMLLLKVIKYLLQNIRVYNSKFHSPVAFTRTDKTVSLSLLVKIFFIPLMTVFFTDQFTHLVGNFNYLAGLFREQSFLKRFAVADFYNVSFTFIIAVDVGVAWCGYVLASRWIKTGYVSVEPTLLGWVAALLCYPPTWLVFQAYFVLPSEKAFFAIPNHGLVWLFAIISIASYMIYMSATLAFGLRFSNLTHRGIIRNGPYAYIRHPAYAAKNFSWWCVIFPFVLFQIFGQGKVEAAVYIIGLIATTYLYYMRVITEERHLSMDPEYQDYCKQVPYRFIPKLL